MLDSGGYHETIEQCPYDLLTIWNVEYIQTRRRPLPHVEDVSVQCRQKASCNKVHPKELLKLPNYNIKVYINESLLNTFEQKLCSTDSGSLFICERNGVPNFSTCFWICDKPLKRNRYSTEDKIKYDYYGVDGKWYHITYVGVDNIPDLIPTGTLIRLSLAHWWHPDGQDENRCYLQLSGIYNVNE